MSRFCTALCEGQPCGRRALPGQPFCCGHQPHPYTPHQCEYFNQRGQRCRAFTLCGQDHCFAHSPRNRRARRPAVPIVPRTRRPRDQARWFIFSNMPESQKTLLEALPMQ
jgi:hypothetical protein